VRDLQAAAPAGAAANSVAGPKAVFTYRAAQATVLAPLVCLSAGALDEAIVSAYVNDLFTWCASPARLPRPLSSSMVHVSCPFIAGAEQHICGVYARVRQVLLAASTSLHL